MDIITKKNANEVTFTKEVVEVRDFETLIRQRGELITQQEDEEKRFAERNAMRVVELAKIEEALATGIVKKPDVVEELAVELTK